MSNNTALPTQVHAIHPDNRKNFKALAPKSKDIRTSRSVMRTACTNCFRNNGNDDEPELELLRCGKCKSVWYCSKECQRKHWSKHKPNCKEEDGSGVSKLVQNLYANQLLNKHIQACFILHFGLLQNPHLDKPFMARIDLGIEPADITDFLKVFMGEPLGETTMKGMLQINKFCPATPEQMEGLTPMRMNIWREARASTDRAGFRNTPVGLIEFGNGMNPQTLTCPVRVGEDALDLVNESPPWVMTSAITGESNDLPFNIETCMEFMNTHIRADKKDQLLLRTDMRPSDIQIMRDAANGATTIPGQILRAKMAREDIFKPVMAGAGWVGRVPLV
ncbi:hypothetical protein C8R47DRAFT_1135927 [Mycena vitilis]|nr:hypothetical protein C8R47DRAFT_1135927 [Mycena vitilis]